MGAITTILSSTVSLCVIMSVLVILIILVIIALCISIKGLKNTLGYCQTTIDDMNENIQNVARASKRIERMSDAVNQRTKAHLISKDGNKAVKKPSINKPKVNQNKKPINKRGSGKHDYIFKSVKKTADYSFTDSSVDYD